MVATAGAPVSEQAQRRMRSHFSLQEWLDTEASKFAWALTVLSAVSRGASFYSGSATALTHLLGITGMRLFDGISGVGIAFGAEMLASIAGRAWQRNTASARAVMGAPNLKRQEREAERKGYEQKARIDFVGMCIGIFSTTSSSFLFLLASNADHAPLTIINEVLVTVFLVSIMTYIGVFNTTPRTDPSEQAQGQALEVRSATTEASGRRIASGVFSPDDVYVVASQLPKSERDRFVSALIRPEVDDPMWGTREMCDWLGVAALPSEQDELAARRRLTRLLAKVAKEDVRIQKNAKGMYQVPRSLALVYLADLYIELHRASQRAMSDRAASAPRQPDWLNRLVEASDTSQDASQPTARPDSGQAESAVKIVPIVEVRTS